MLRFFFIQTLKKTWSKVARLIDSAQTQFHRVLLMTLYGTGARRAELCKLQIPDIDSRRMVVHIRGGKGRQDRDVMLSSTLLHALRGYFRGLKCKPNSGYSPADIITPPIAPSAPGPCDMPAIARRNMPASKIAFIPTPCALFRYALAGKRR